MGRTPTVEQIVQQAADEGLVEPEMENLPTNVANALRSMIAGERPAPTLPPRAIARLGKVIAHWGVPHGRSTLGFGTASMVSLMAQAMGQPPPEKPAAPKAPRKVSKGLIKQAGLPPHKAARVEAVVRWPIGFTRADLAHWGLLSEEESATVWNYIAREYGFYTTGTLYAAP